MPAARNLERREVLKLSLAASAATLGLGAPAIAQQPKTLRFGHNLPNTSLYHKAIQLFADEVAKNSGNKLKVDIFPSSQLGGMSEMIQSVQTGSLTFSMAVPAWYSSFMKPIDVFTLPYLVSSTPKLKTALDGPLGNAIVKMGEGTGFQIIGYWLIGGRHIVNRVRAVQKPEDCKGLKVRVINSQVYLQTFRALGANPIAMDPSEIYLALQQGVIDGFDFALPDLFAYKFYEVAKFLTLDSHTTDFFVVSTGKNTWNGFSKDERDAISKAIGTAMDWQWKEQPAEIDGTLVKLRNLMQVTELTPANRELFVQATRPIHKEFENAIGKDFLALATRELAS